MQARLYFGGIINTKKHFDGIFTQKIDLLHCNSVFSHHWVAEKATLMPTLSSLTEQS
jgi:hypothetical protein